jgi:hypothetical protein
VLCARAGRLGVMDPLCNVKCLLSKLLCGLHSVQMVLGWDDVLWLASQAASPSPMGTMEIGNSALHVSHSSPVT